MTDLAVRLPFKAAEISPVELSEPESPCSPWKVLTMNAAEILLSKV